jgi:queuine tRNA-ribosyltransferase
MFKIIKTSKLSKARLGILSTSHGNVETPFFMPIATKAVVKNLTPKELEELGVKIILANSYHLLIKPGIEVIKKIGGLHRFMGWEKPILTDSGGYQVFSLAKMRKITDLGVKFMSEIDGSEIFLTPEKVIEVQQIIGSDILMVLDECISYPASYNEAKKAVERTTNWAKRSKIVFERKDNQLFGIIQGSIYEDLRVLSAKQIVELDFDGYAIGGLVVGEPLEETYRMIEIVEPYLPKNKPRYLMGLGEPGQMVEAIKRGIDMFDCVIPTRNARHGLIYRKRSSILEKEFYEEIRIKNEKYKNVFEPVDKNCQCHTCLNFSLAYLRHLFNTDEPLGQRLATIHNLKFYLDLVEEVKELIKKGLF